MAIFRVTQVMYIFASAYPVYIKVLLICAEVMSMCIVTVQISTKPTLIFIASLLINIAPAFLYMTATQANITWVLTRIG